MSFSKWELLDSHGGVIRWGRYSDDDEGTVQVKTEQDCSRILDDNKAASNDFTGKMADGLGVLAARIPTAVQLQWLIEDGVWWSDDMDWTARKLNSPDWMHLKRVPFQL